MAKVPVLKHRQLKDKTTDELKDILRKNNQKLSGNKEELIERAILSSYPVYRFPKARPSSIKGYVLLAYVEPGGEPRKEAVSDREVVEGLLEKGLVATKERAEQYVKLYKYNLVRYYGYQAVNTGEKTRFVKR